MRKGWMWDDTTLVDDHGNHPWHVYSSHTTDDAEVPCYVFTEEEMEALVERVAKRRYNLFRVLGSEKWASEPPWVKANSKRQSGHLREARSIVMGEEHGN